MEDPADQLDAFETTTEAPSLVTADPFDGFLVSSSSLVRQVEGPFIGELLDTGPSLAGWSRLSQFMKCPYLFGRRYVDPLDPMRLAAVSPRVSTLKKFDSGRDLGTTGHAGMAHWLGQWGAREGGIIAADRRIERASDLAPPEEAIQRVGRKLGVTAAGVDSVILAFRDFIRNNPKPFGRPIAVESMIISVVGIKEAGPLGAGFGLWVVTDFDKDNDADVLTAIDGSSVKVARLVNCRPCLDGSRNPREGQRVFITRRLDATFCTETWRSIEVGETLGDVARDLVRYNLTVDVDDHKFRAEGFSASMVEHYERDGQFACARTMANQVYGSARGRVMLNLIHRIHPFTHGRAEMEPQGEDAQLAWQVLEWEYAIASAYAITDVAYWRRTNLEGGCKGKFGRCDLFYHCRNE